MASLNSVIEKDLVDFKGLCRNSDGIVDCYYATRENQHCGGCGQESLTVDGYWGLGVKLVSGHTPRDGELIKNNYMVCSSCNFEQWS